MDGSSDTELSSSLESYQSCPDDDGTGGSPKEEPAAAAAGLCYTTTHDVDPQREQCGRIPDVIGAEDTPSRFERNLSDDDIATLGGTFWEAGEDTSGIATSDSTFEEQTGNIYGGLMASTPVTVDRGSLDEKKQKLLNSASKKLRVVSDKLKYFLMETSGRGKTVQQQLDKIESNKVEVEKALSDHVQYLHSLLDYYHSEQKELLRQQHKDFLKALMVNKTEELNFEARLKDVQKKVESTLQRITKEGDVTVASTENVDDLCDEYHRRVSSRPAKKDHDLTYLVEIPQVTADEIQVLCGHYIFPGTSKNAKASRPYPAPRWPINENTSTGPNARSKADSSSSSTSSQPSTTSFRTPDPSKYPPNKASSGKATQDQRTAGNPPTSSLRFSKENRAKGGVSSSESSRSQCSTFSVQPKECSAPLDSKQKLSEVMASSSSIASMGSVSGNKAKKRTRSRKRRKTKDVETKKDAAESPQPVMITLLHEGRRPKKVQGRAKQARGFAARPNGELWVVYGDRDPHLDHINEEGDMLESCRIGGNAMHAASFNEETVLVAFHSPFCQLRLIDSNKECQETSIKLPLIPTGMGVGSTGIAVCSYKSVYWISLDGGKNDWIVKEKKSTLKNACSCDVIIQRGREIVCVADSDGHKVWFFEKLDNGEFTPLPLFTYASHSHNGKTVPFSPMCLSFLAGTSFLAVLDAASRSVLMVNVDKNEVVSVIGSKELCDGVPSLITFTHSNAGEDPKLWVATDAEYLYLVSLAFLY